MQETGSSGKRNGWLKIGEGGKLIFTIHVYFYDLKFAICTCISYSQKNWSFKEWGVLSIVPGGGGSDEGHSTAMCGWFTVERQPRDIWHVATASPHLLSFSAAPVAPSENSCILRYKAASGFSGITLLSSRWGNHAPERGENQPKVIQKIGAQCRDLSSAQEMSWLLILAVHTGRSLTFNQTFWLYFPPSPMWIISLPLLDRSLHGPPNAPAFQTPRLISAVLSAWNAFLLPVHLGRFYLCMEAESQLNGTSSRKSSPIMQAHRALSSWTN